MMRGGNDSVERLSESAPCARVVSVVEKDGRAAKILGGIFLLCGRKNCRVVPYGGPVPPNAARPVLLVCGDRGDLDASGYSVCVAERELSDRIAAPRLITYSTGRNDADFTARNIRRLPDGRAAFEIVGIGVIGRVRLADGDLSAVAPSLAAAAAAVGAGVPFAEALRALNGGSAESREPESRGRADRPGGQFTE